MKKLYYFFVLLSQFITAQVGINTTDPKAQLDIKSSNQLTPSNTDGLLIPKIDAFPAINPTAAQQGMLVYLTTDVGANVAGFYYWNNSPAAWLPIKGNNGVTLDQAYDFGGAGNGKIITADSGAVLINGTDGLVSTGTVGSGAIAPSGSGTKMFWNPRKSAFRAGQIDSGLTMWDDVNIGERSAAFGGNTTASGNSSVAFGAGTTASGLISTAFGNSTLASNIFSTAFGGYTIASGTTSTAFGSFTTASGVSSTAFGVRNTAPSFAETVMGIGATTYTPSANGDTEFRTANATDRLFVIGNALDVNNNFAIDTAERSDALIILKNGLTRLPSTTNAMITAADGKAVVTKEYLQSNTSGTLDQAYDFGGAGLGKNITADAGAVLIDGTDGLVSTGISGSGAVMPSGAGTRMVWNPRKAAFRVGTASATEWNDVNVGTNSIAMGFGTRALGSSSIALGSMSSASGMGSVAFGWSANASATQSTAFGLGTNANNIYATAFGYQTIASGRASTSFGIGNETESFGEVVLGIGATSYTPSSNGANQFRTANATDRLFVIGNAIDSDNDDTVDATERSDAMIVLKNGLTRLPSTTNAMINAADGKAVVTKEYLATNASGWGLSGNSGTNASTNFIGTTDNVDLVLKTNNTNKVRIKNNGEIEIGNNGIIHDYENSAGINPKLIVASESAENNIFFQATVNSNDGPSLYFSKARGNNANPQMIQQNDEIARIHFHGFTGDKFASAAMIFSQLDGVPSISSMPGKLQFGTTSEGNLQSSIRMTIRNNGNVGIGTEIPERLLHLRTSDDLLTEGLLYLNQAGTGDALMHFGIANGRHYNIGVDATDDAFKIGTSATAMNAVSIGTLMTIEPTGQVGIGTANPLQKLHVSGPAGLTAVRIGNTSTIGTSSNVALDFFRSSNANTDWRIYNIGANLTFGNSGDDLTTVNDLYQFQGVRFMPMNDATQSLGQLANRWNTVFASNGTINTSDARQKKNINNLTYGLKDLMKLRPVSFEWKKDDGSGTKLGLIAQELQEVIPEVVRDWDWQEDEQGNRKKVAAPILGVFYSDLIPVLIRATQEQQQLIENQKLEIEQLKQKVEWIVTEMEKLKK